MEETNQDYADNFKKWKIICNEIVKDLEEADPNKKSIDHLENAVNWMLSISAATLTYLSIIVLNVTFLKLITRIF